MYTYMNPDPVFGSFGVVGDWWEPLSDEAKIEMLNWAADSARRQRLSADWDRLVAQANAAANRDVALHRGEAQGAERRRAEIARYVTNFLLSNLTRSVADGGGIAFGLHCLCYSTSPGGLTKEVGIDEPCPAGTGGIAGTSGVATRSKPVTKTLVKMPRPRPPSSDATKATIKGKVVDAVGTGIAGAAVSVTPPPGGSFRAGTFASVVTGADGSFSADVKPTTVGTVDVAVTAAGYVGATASGVPAVGGQETNDVRIPLVAVGGAPPPPTCDPGFILDLVTAACVPVGGDGGGPPPIICPEGSVLAPDGVSCVTAGGGFTCPTGYVLAPDGVSCVPLAEKALARPWYKRASTWLAVGGVLLVGGGVAVAASRRRR